MFKKISWLSCVVSITILFVFLPSVAFADSFGTGANQFNIDFAMISGETNPTSGYGIVNNDYRIGKYEITNDQWNKFKANLGIPVIGAPSSAYDEDAYWTGTKMPTNEVSWYEAAQFVNWLNINTNHQVAYKFTGSSFDTWNPAEADNGTNLYRHKDAFYYLPTVDEWTKAGYWNGTNLQLYAIKYLQPDDTIFQGDGISGTGWNYTYNNVPATDPFGPWEVGSGSEELNGTYDIMGNVWEWMENPSYSGDYGTYSYRMYRGGCYSESQFQLVSHNEITNLLPDTESNRWGFRIASEVPEPTSISLLFFGSLALLLSKRNNKES